MSEGDHQCREVYYSGRVHGVGFRFTTYAIAAQFNVIGFVRNLPDGRVHLVVEGESEEIDRFVRAVRKEMQNYIANTQEIVGPVSGRFHSFEIKH